MCPNGFRVHPLSHKLSISDTTPIVIERTPQPVPPAGSLKFNLQTNLNDVQEVDIIVDSENRNLWPRLSQKLTDATHGQPTVGDALNLVNASTDSRVSAANKYVLASTLLLSMGQNSTAKTALASAVQRDPSLTSDPSILFLNGVIANREEQPQAALTYFAKAKEVTPANDKSAQSILDLGSGLINFNLGKRGIADSYLKTYDLQKQVWRNPLLPSFAAQEFCTKPEGACASYLSQTLKSGG